MGTVAETVAKAKRIGNLAGNLYPGRPAFAKIILWLVLAEKSENMGLMVETHPCAGKPVTVNRFDRTQDPQPMGYRFSAR